MGKIYPFNVFLLDELPNFGTAVKRQDDSIGYSVGSSEDEFVRIRVAPVVGIPRTVVRVAAAEHLRKSARTSKSAEQLIAAFEAIVLIKGLRTSPLNPVAVRIERLKSDDVLADHSF